ncbi:DUF4926 domain-containing protein [Methylobacterium sp. J-026]|uniref:DUF4926 domain-containing protein n=1 Tax=Methylobacterium sp. J-026 TaxID=2836624 RepID=UPI001FBAF678|nr:DUF4926 domain-containing protein [Methylobacterium sp. J-026]MCJ2134919.1 DUF4926 domain-containing protein [Methylobacterium sp. J-026]
MEEEIIVCAMRAQLPKSGVPSPTGADADEPVRELDRVRVLRSVIGDDDLTVPAGATGTVVGIYADGAAFEVEFTEPVDTLATVDAATVCLVERALR